MRKLFHFLIIAIFIPFACAGTLEPKSAKNVTLDWDCSFGEVIGYKIYVKYYVRNDMKEIELKKVQVEDVGMARSFIDNPFINKDCAAEIPVINMPSMVNRCYAVSAYDGSSESSLSNEICDFPWPPKNFKIE
jgi:hypothetical protein